MKSSELRGMSDEQLRLTLTDTEKHLFQLRFQSATDRLETPSEMRKARRDIARIKTEMRVRELKALAVMPDAQLTVTKELAEKGEQAPGQPIRGRRKPLRIARRLETILNNRAARKVMAPAVKGK